MKCPRCGSDVNERCGFCPKCGSRLERNLFGDVFERVEEEMKNELKSMDRAFERNFEVLDLSPFFRKPIRSSGFSIKITRSGSEKPKVSVKTFGDVDRKELESETGKLGFEKAPKMEKGGRVCLERTRTIEEPETCVRRIGDKIVVEVKLPGVEDTKDIELKSLENSIEVKAISGEKAYFKILTKPTKANIVSKRFENGVLRIELI